MLMITTHCDRSGCDGTVEFVPDRPGRRSASSRRVGTCDQCGALYSLYGGRIQPLSEVLPSPSAPRRPSDTMPSSLAV